MVMSNIKNRRGPYTIPAVHWIRSYIVYLSLRIQNVAVDGARFSPRGLGLWYPSCYPCIQSKVVYRKSLHSISMIAYLWHTCVALCSQIYLSPWAHTCKLYTQCWHRLCMKGWLRVPPAQRELGASGPLQTQEGITSGV